MNMNIIMKSNITAFYHMAKAVSEWSAKDWIVRDLMAIKMILGKMKAHG